MSNTNNIREKLTKHHVVPDVLPIGLNFPSRLTIKWPNTVLDVPGKELDREETQIEPQLYLETSVSDVCSADDIITID